MDPRLRQLFDAERAGYPALTIELARRHLAACPDDFFALRIYGDALTSIALYDEAAAAYDRALSKLTPGTDADRHSRLYACIGHLERARCNVVLAESSYRRAVELTPSDAAPRIYLGALLAVLGRLEEAKEVHEVATRAAEGALDEAWLNLGFVRRAQGDYLGAMECFRRTLELDPADADAQAALRDVEQVLFEFPPAHAAGGDLDIPTR